MAGSTLQDRPDGSLGYTRDEFWRIAAEYPVKAIVGCDAHALGALSPPRHRGKESFPHSLGIPGSEFTGRAAGIKRSLRGRAASAILRQEDRCRAHWGALPGKNIMSNITIRPMEPED